MEDGLFDITIVSGTRLASINPTLVHLAIRRHARQDGLIIAGDATGVDEITRSYCKQYGVPIRIFEADWHTYGKSAGPIRNADMLAYGMAAAEFVEGTLGLVAVHVDPQVEFASKGGTADMIRRTMKAGVPYVFYADCLNANGGYPYVSYHPGVGG